MEVVQEECALQMAHEFKRGHWSMKFEIHKTRRFSDAVEYVI